MLKCICLLQEYLQGLKSNSYKKQIQLAFSQNNGHFCSFSEMKAEYFLLPWNWWKVKSAI